MPDLSQTASWVWVVLVAGVLLLSLGGYFLGRYLGYVTTRRHLVGLIGRRENLLASKRTLEAVMRHLADESDELLIEFAANPESEDRRALVETASRMRMLTDDLDVIPLPKALVPLGDALADAAFVLAEESGRVQAVLDADAVLTALGTVDLARVEGEYDRAARLLDEMCDDYGVEDAAVYGGGLYI